MTLVPQSASVSRNVIAISEGATATLSLIEQVLDACRVHGIVRVSQPLASLNRDHLDGAALPLMVRCADPVAGAWARELSRSNYPYAYYLDDNFWALEGDSALATYYRHPSVRASLDCCVREASLVLVHSRTLQRFLAGMGIKSTVVPAMFDFRLIEGVARETTSEIRVGFAGSVSRQRDLRMLESVVPALLAFDSRIAVEFVGGHPPGMKETDRCRFFPHMPDYQSFIRFQMQRGWSVGLGPLDDTLANRCKTDNKYREYSACGIPGVYPDIAPYSESVEHMKTGLLVADDPASWIEAILFLVRHREEAARIAAAARLDVWSRYRLDVVAREWATVMAGLSLPPRICRLSAIQSSPSDGLTLRLQIVRCLIGSAMRGDQPVHDLCNLARRGASRLVRPSFWIAFARHLFRNVQWPDL